MYYTIGQVSERFELPISTLRYYDKEGLFPDLKRENGIRRFSDQDLETLNIIECLKLSGLEIKDIKKFMQWCAEGASTYEKRHQLFLRQKETVEAQIERLHQTLDMIRFKCWYYETAIADGNEERLAAMRPDHFPEEIQKLYDHGHGKQEDDASAQLQSAG